MPYYGLDEQQHKGLAYICWKKYGILQCLEVANGIQWYGIAWAECNKSVLVGAFISRLWSRARENKMIFMRLGELRAWAVRPVGCDHMVQTRI